MITPVVGGGKSNPSGQYGFAPCWEVLLVNDEFALVRRRSPSSKRPSDPNGDPADAWVGFPSLAQRCQHTQPRRNFLPFDTSDFVDAQPGQLRCLSLGQFSFPADRPQIMRQNMAQVFGPPAAFLFLHGVLSLPAPSSEFSVARGDGAHHQFGWGTLPFTEIFGAIRQISCVFDRNRYGSGPVSRSNIKGQSARCRPSMTFAEKSSS